MKRTLAILITASALTVLGGCAGGLLHNIPPQASECPCDQTCNDPAGRCCRGRHCLAGGRVGDAALAAGAAGAAAQAGPSVGQVTYPYYTLRGPRDFLEQNPTPIGP